jgi:hypothetical protein
MRLQSRKGWRTVAQPEMPDELAARRERQETNTELQGGRPGAEWIWGAVISGPGEFAHKSLGYGWGSDPGYSPALIRRGRLQRDTHEGSVDHRLRWSTHQASAVRVGVVCSSLRLSREILGNSRAPPQNPGGHLPGILGKSGILTASFEGAPITTGEEAGSQSRDSAACED